MLRTIASHSLEAATEIAALDGLLIGFIREWFNEAGRAEMEIRPRIPRRGLSVYLESSSPLGTSISTMTEKLFARLKVSTGPVLA